MTRSVDQAKWTAFTPRRWAWLAVGSGALALGAVGILLPLLPTTPFIILAAFAYGKSAPGIALRLERSRTFGPILAGWRCHGAIAPRYKILAMLMMIGSFVFSAAMSVAIGILIVQAICLALAAAFILSRPDGPGR